MGTAERRLKLMKLLCHRRYETISNLASEFGVSVRTIQRDIDELGYMIPLEIKTGRYQGGVYVMEGYSWDKMYMSKEDILLLKTIRKAVTNNIKLQFNKETLKRLDKIIETYTMPRAK